MACIPPFCELKMWVKCYRASVLFVTQQCPEKWKHRHRFLLFLLFFKKINGQQISESQFWPQQVTVLGEFMSTSLPRKLNPVIMKKSKKNLNYI